METRMPSFNTVMYDGHYDVFKMLEYLQLA